jgi:dinuclear metal center YbgI/SA1388 family protein
MEELAPLSYAASWDNCGLQFGNPGDACRGILVSVNPSLAAAQEAGRLGANLLITHHPLLFKATKRLDTRVDPGRIIQFLAEAGITSYAAHTNLDATACNHHLSKLFGIPMDRPLEVEGRHPFYKLVVTVPIDQSHGLLEALWAAGAGKLGEYDRAGFWSDGTASFRPLQGATPAVGAIAQDHAGPERRIEVLVPGRVRGAVLGALSQHHPYESPAYDLIRLENAGEPYGIGLWGELPSPMTAYEVAERVRTGIHPRTLRLVGDGNRPVSRVGVCSGAGGDLVNRAIELGLDLFITGEVRYHTALEAAQQGLCLVEAGHQATEEPVVDVVVEYLRARFPDLAIQGFSEPEPFEVLAP